ncbi:tRNA (cytosine(34)-C(5))-methyltransferase, mitochondrial [Denticeps clupeoides]|uniref:SAM-dependent MTase RsmB/NOP-type domain-containing protein n=1 Tax=Denticeps clupeoides TaxID=299321 RepID=A0AAY4BR99_9TELE|nr:tRNA (cytosine(34)-C(5))-methyltransferase, mitochondrial [Denticeps clupeoides]
MVCAARCPLLWGGRGSGFCRGAALPQLVLPRKKRQVCQAVLDHFDAQYGKELGSLWSNARSVLMNPGCWQYGVMLNRFADLPDLRQTLLELGYSSLLPCSAVGTGSLQCLVHEGPVRLSTQAHNAGCLKDYFLMNAASLLPVLALGVRDGDKVLDLCSAPGGKAVAVLQSASPGLLHCNELDNRRFIWLQKTLESFVPPTQADRLKVTNLDGRVIGHSQKGQYDKVLVDAPCSNDRSWLYAPNTQQGAVWLKEREGRLPQLQMELLSSALTAVRPGGTVVYSTCTLSHAENHAVVEAILNSCPGVEPRSLEEDIAMPLSEHFTFASPITSTGLLVVPDHGRTWGPMFVAQLKRTH